MAWLITFLNFECSTITVASQQLCTDFSFGQKASVGMGSRAKNELIFLQCMWIMPCLNSV